MTKKTDEERLKEEHSEAFKAWKKLRLIPEYQRDFHNSKNGQPDELEYQRLQKLWGFLPLHDPQDETPSFEFLCFFSDYKEGVSRFIEPIDWNKLDYFSRRGDKVYDPNGYLCETNPIKGNKVTITVDLSFTVDTLSDDFKKTIKHLQYLAGIKPSNTRSHDHLEYLVNCLEKFDLSSGEIVKRLFVEEIEFHKLQKTDTFLQQEESWLKQV
jgi:hypothetical protein